LKILILGSEKPYALEHAFVRAFEEKNIPASILPSADYFWSQYESNFTQKIATRLHLKRAFKEVQNTILNQVVKTSPDVLFVFKGMEILPETLSKLKEKNLLMVNFNPDDPFLFTSFGSGNKNILNSHKLYDIHFCYNRRNLKRFNKMRLKAVWLPFAFDDLESNLNAQSTEEIHKPCFIGNYDTKRGRLLDAVAKSYGKIDLYGKGWNTENLDANIQYNGVVENKAYHKTIGAYRCQLNVFREHNENSTNMRVFEIWGNSGISINPYSEEIKDLNPPDVEFMYRNSSDLNEKLNLVMELSTHEASKLKEECKEFCLEKHTYRNRVNTVIEELNKLS
jgi:hypothetical protein